MGVVPPAGQSRFAERHGQEGWKAWVRSEVGAVRERLEDAWKVLAAAELGGEAWDAFAVFDGIGGSPHGQEAAWAAAEGLRDAMAKAAAPQELLRLLDGVVLPTGGATTAVVALAQRARPGDVWLLGAGDSSVHAPGERASVLPRDRVGLNVVTDGLGLPLRRGHAVRWQVPPGGALLLCTDGVDDVAGLAAVQECLAAPAQEAEAAVDRLLARVNARGAPDNATVVLLRRT